MQILWMSIFLDNVIKTATMYLPTGEDMLMLW